jgi:DHA2 family multidrug resistance protein
MGLMFTPLNMTAMSNIPRHKIGQASGLFNVIRQLGGSFGIAFMSTMLLRRTIYHMSTFGQAVNPQSDAFRQVAGHLTQFSMDAIGGNQSLAAMRANALIASHISTQAFIRAVCDDFLVASMITIAAFVPIVFLRIRKREKTEHVVAMD